MSATPPNPPANRGRPNVPFLRARRPRPADPLVRPKKRPVPRPPAQGQPRAPGANGAALPKPRPIPPHPQARPQPRPQPKIPSADDMTVNGFSGPLLSESYVDYPLVTTKRAWRDALKHHVAKFASKKNIDPRDESQFTRPVRLQRRDPRSVTTPHPADNPKEERKGPGEGRPGLTEAEREELEAKKELREKEREENIAQIAPSGSGGPKRVNAPKQRTQQVFKSEMTPQEIAKARIKYEEALPWHLEDFDNKGIWVGNYEAAMSETYAMFVLQNDGKMRMVPIDKWYKFSSKNQFRALTIEEVEKFMARKIKDPRWFMEKEEGNTQRKTLDAYAKQRRVFTGSHGAPAGDGFEGDDMDFEEDRFADDEEHAAGLVEEDEDQKVAEKRIKEDQLKANVFDLKDEKAYDDESDQEKKEKEALKNFGKKVRRALQKREKNFDYSSGSDANPYSEDESSEDSEVERAKEEQKKAEEERKHKEKSKESDRSGASTKGTSTPSGRQKQTDALKKPANLSVRKRPGSPGLSDASGTDTSRKKPKNKHAPSQGVSQPGSRPMSPSPSGPPSSQQTQRGQPAASGKKRVRNGPAGSGSGSDAERAAGSAGEMSDTAVTKKLKLNAAGVRSRTGTPHGSRAGSPAARPPTRTSTPVPMGAAPSSAQFPTAAEIYAAIPASGITSADLLKVFRPRIGESRENSRKFIGIVRDVSIFVKEDKMLRPGTLKEPSS
ncbi:hypothetical protein AJ80_02905 [Polytolypa hystricis UAMH7299]|uniref:Transcription initiation factor IIF subunit alpha n=1 Tax=Polytolypa hystricis (strain UAMH7299) TaxID=1447883 RepID=A0A2B7YP74_POLH7|nr:hypothetical protein AJ80_02905 [Polytolypa hystricis UAMH7299]